MSATNGDVEATLLAFERGEYVEWHDDFRAFLCPDSLDAAWADVEAALRKAGLTGYEVVELWRRWDGWLATAAGTGRNQPPRPISNDEPEDTPAAALRALDAKLLKRAG